ncbi:DUF4262 domain-containing protein [Amycolatopsis cihanbeyliensis]|uniref:Uncharacterized protein DUF4262 n=1 Tax=Amycolatopsis cihanbeyliensis TaxID=1128664 RepID=A0A542DGJ5_AMYCI|nr:uncharacterized protein DUF4262 [Amycolatopsis cihanbeyliensis]
MCWACDNPDKTTRDYLEVLRGIIARSGWAVQGVEPGRIHPPWAYTVGLTELDRPELVVTGLPLHQCHELLNDAAHHLLHTGTPPPGEQLRLPGRPPLVEVVELPEPSAHLNMAIAMYRRGVRALQLVHPDIRGRWPWDRGYRGGDGGQPVLGPRSTPPVRRHGTGGEPGPPAERPGTDFPDELSTPALRALVEAGYRRLAELDGVREVEITRLHGMGPKGIDRLRAALAAHGMSFAETGGKGGRG